VPAPPLDKLHRVRSTQTLARRSSAGGGSASVDVPVSRMLVTGAGVDRHTLTASTPHSRLSRAFLETFDTVPRDV